MAKSKKRKKTASKWTHHYRMVVINDDTFEERFSLKLNRLNVFVVTTLFAIVLVSLTTIIIAFTPLREFIPGYSSTKIRKQTAALVKRTDSLQERLMMNEQQYQRIKMVLTGNITMEEYNQMDSIIPPDLSQELVDIKPNIQDSLLREEVAREDRFNVIEGATARTNFVFFTPVTGTISSEYDAVKGHYAVDVAAPMNTPVKAAADGTVIFSSWSADTGNTMIVEHSYGLITAYKHMNTLLKGQNDQVLAGEVIGSVGSTGELTTGPHLHFELWSDGYPLDPTNFIIFE